LIREIEGRERPTGGLVGLPSSEAVEEAGHFERIVRLRVLVGKKHKPLKHGGKEEMEEQNCQDRRYCQRIQIADL